jgi:hypothetical protein
MSDERRVEDATRDTTATRATTVWWYRTRGGWCVVTRERAGDADAT